ncbi:non-specific DNA-binding protein Dps, partial [human gut metagenome]
NLNFTTMKTMDYLHLNASAVNGVVNSLKSLLADYQIFYANLRGLHWNIRGRAFFVLHAKFEELYDNAAAKVDELAERILMLGGEPENRFSEYLKTARLQEVSGVSCPMRR